MKTQVLFNKIMARFVAASCQLSLFLVEVTDTSLCVHFPCFIVSHQLLALLTAAHFHKVSKLHFRSLMANWRRSLQNELSITHLKFITSLLKSRTTLLRKMAIRQNGLFGLYFQDSQHPHKKDLFVFLKYLFIACPYLLTTPIWPGQHNHNFQNSVLM